MLINFEKQNLMKQNKKLVWITGASSGIGKELCYKFSQENWNIALTARRKDKLLKITKEIGSNNTITLPEQTGNLIIKLVNTTE